MEVQNKLHIFITPNRRLELYLKKRLKDRNLYVFTLSDWQKIFWEKMSAGFSDCKIISETERDCLWQNIIQDWSDGSFLQSEQCANLASEAYILCREWNLNLKQGFDSSENTQVFADWAMEYERRLAKLNYIDPTDALKEIIRLLKVGSRAETLQNLIPQRITWMGFTAFSPLVQEFKAALRSQGAEIQEEDFLEDAESGAALQYITLADFETELKTALLWAAQKVKINPKIKIGIIIPELGARLKQVLRTIPYYVEPVLCRVSAPLSLIEYPCIAALFLGLNILKPTIRVEELSLFLRSPYFGTLAEKSAEMRVQLELFLREQRRSYFTAQELQEALQIPINQSGWQGQKNASEWKPIFEESLKTLNHIFYQDLNNDGNSMDDCRASMIQFKDQWENLLQDFSNCDPILGPLSYESAVQELQSLVQKKLFLAKPPQNEQSEFNPPIEILGLFEALSLPFDASWVLGLHRDNWPMPAEPNPFIPYALQKQHQLPKSSPARELEMAKLYTEVLCRGAREVIFSAPQFEGEEERGRSVLLQFIPELKLEEISHEAKTLHPELHETASVDFFDFNEAAPPLQETHSAAHNAALPSFSANALKLQSLCPFRAFAELRLQAIPLAAFDSSLSPAERGEILHAILKQIWSKLKNQAAFLALSDEAIAALIHSAITQVLETEEGPESRFARFKGFKDSQYLKLEKERLFKIIYNALELEKTRLPFEVIKLEAKQSFKLGPLKFNIRMDRKDKLATGEEILIDYKTGQVSVAAWFGERPSDPQLPLYGLADEKKPEALAFMQFNPKGIVYQGVQNSEEAGLKGLKTLDYYKRYEVEETLELQFKKWQERLEKLAQELFEGVARVDPLHGETTCRNCSLKPLCRVNEI